ncbi:hypothetical protein Nmel_000219 [Mimus melanotis]
MWGCPPSSEQPVIPKADLSKAI